MLLGDRDGIVKIAISANQKMRAWKESVTDGSDPI
jgi:hypothetical protein